MLIQSLKRELLLNLMKKSKILEDDEPQIDDTDRKRLEKFQIGRRRFC